MKAKKEKERKTERMDRREPKELNSEINRKKEPRIDGQKDRGGGEKK